MSAQDSDVPEALASALDKLVTLFGALRATNYTERPAMGADGPRQAHHKVLTISGPRGAGKTTLLYMLATRLAANDDVIVLPPLEPEMFGSGDTIFGAVIARLQSKIERVEPLILADTEVQLASPLGNLNVAQALDRLLRYAALVGDQDHASAVTPSSLEQYSSDFAKTALAGETFIGLWDATISACCHALGAPMGLSPVIVVPIDDPDLAPGLLARILHDVRLLATTPNVIICVCLDLLEARRVLNSGYAKALGLDPSQIVPLGVTEAQLAKALPQRSRVVLSGLTRRERLSFTPFDSHAGSLGALLQTFAIAAPERDFTIGDLFVIVDSNGGETPSAYADCLPALPRDLESLYFSLCALTESDVNPYHSEEAARVIIEAAVKAGFRSTPIPEHEPDSLLSFERAAGDDDKPQVRIDFGPIRYATQSQQVMMFRPIRERQDIVVALAEISTLGTYEYGDKEEQRLSQSLILGLVLPREFTRCGEVFAEELSGGEPVRGAKSSGLLNLGVGAARADDLFLVFPRWQTYYDYFAFDAAWRETIGDATSLGRESHSPRLLAGVAITFLIAVGEISQTRTAKPAEHEVLSSLVSEEGSDEPLLILWQKARASLLAATDAVRPGSPRYEAFHEWLGQWLPMVCHPWILPGWVIDEIFELRAEVLAKMDGAYQLNAGLAEVLDRRIRANLGEEWVTPLFDVFERFTDIPLVGLKEAHDAARLQRMRRIGSIATEPPFGDIEADELARRARDILRAMRAEEEQGADLP